MVGGVDPLIHEQVESEEGEDIGEEENQDEKSLEVQLFVSPNTEEVGDGKGEKPNSHYEHLESRSVLGAKVLKEYKAVISIHQQKVDKVYCHYIGDRNGNQNQFTAEHPYNQFVYFFSVFGVEPWPKA